MAALTQRWIQGHPDRVVFQLRLAWWYMPLLVLVVGMIAAERVSGVLALLPVLMHVFWLFVGFLFGTALLVEALFRIFRLPVTDGRALAFRLGTRNSFLVLPLADSAASWMGNRCCRDRLSIHGGAFRNGLLLVVDLFVR